MQAGIKRGKNRYIRHMEYLHKNEVMISELSQEELNQLFVQDELRSRKF